MGKSRSSSVDGVDESLLHFERILEFVKRDYPELSFDHDLSERWIVVIRLYLLKLYIAQVARRVCVVNVYF